MMPLHLPRTPLTRTPLTRTITLLSISLPTALFSTMAASKSAQPPSPSSPTPTSTFPAHPYTPRHTTYPYTPADFHRQDSSPDTDFYAHPRFVTHIDDNAIRSLKDYYAANLPRKGRILDLCSSWISHLPRELEDLAVAGKDNGGGEQGLEVVGLGMNKKELDANPVLRGRVLQDLNTDAVIPVSLGPIDATTCVVSIDYLTRPLEVLSSVLERTRAGGSVHLVVSNRCFPTKAVGRWLRVGEEERLGMVGDFLWFSGWRGIEVVVVCDGRGRAGGLWGVLGGGVDPLWVVRGVKGGGGEVGGGDREQ